MRCIVLPALALAACADGSRTPQADAPVRVAGPPLPSYQIAAAQDVSFGAVVRLSLRASLPAHYSRQDVERIAKAIADSVSSVKRVNAIAIAFYGPDASTEGVWDVASVDWAPGGDWSSADRVRAGDYSTHQFAVQYKDETAEPESVLTASGAVGLLEVPLPTGAKLVKRTPGDAEASRDPREEYRLDATEADLSGFFARALREAGWRKEGTSTPTLLIYRKGGSMVAVLIPKGGGRFEIMGS